jgi:hypothetical protein
MANHHLRNENLSLKSKGLLSQMLSLPDNWDYTLKGLSMINQESIDCIREAVRELERAGYIQRIRERNDKGHLKGTLTHILLSDRRSVTGCCGESGISHGRQNWFNKSPSQKMQEPANEADVATKRDSLMSDTADRRNLSNGAAQSVQPTREYPRLENPTLDNPTQGKSTQGNPTLGNPMLDEPTQGYPMQGYPTLENPTQLSTYPSSKDSTSTESPNKKSSSTEPKFTETRNSHPSNPSPINLSIPITHRKSTTTDGMERLIEDIDSLRDLVSQEHRVSVHRAAIPAGNR